MKREKEYFCGWYFKCESEDHTIAVIPAYHMAGDAAFCSLQLVTEEGAYYVTFPEDAFAKGRRSLSVKVGESVFSSRGLRLELHSPEAEAQGRLRFGRLRPIRYDIMGPFCLVPGMECRHSVFSMCHRVDGRITVNGREYLFRDGRGYIEGDRGRSFPSRYAWTQCNLPEGALMLSAADIPLGPFHFTGIICVVVWRGKEYRLATYLGARAVSIGNGRIVVRQGGLELTARLICKREQVLKAPAGGAMTRSIRESAACRASYRFRVKGRTVFDCVSERAAFEYEYPQ